MDFTGHSHHRADLSKNSNLEQASSAKVAARRRSNCMRKYPRPGKDAGRLVPIDMPAIQPSFSIGPEETIFAVGSCFARNLEHALIKAGMRVLSREFELGSVADSRGFSGNFFNKYTIHSIVNDLKWALERDTFPGEALYYSMRDGTYCDCQLGIAKLDGTLDEIVTFRHNYLDAIAQIKHADVIVVTLGYVETWYDTQLEIYLNVTPPHQLRRDYPDRFEFRVLSYHDVIEGLGNLYALLRRHRTGPIKMLATVSPVPLSSTFRDMDVLVANTYSKAVQRAAIEEFVLTHDGVDYFPSYEFVALSDPSLAWKSDEFRHVSPKLVDRIMSEVLSSYFDAPRAET